MDWDSKAVLPGPSQGDETRDVSWKVRRVFGTENGSRSRHERLVDETTVHDSVRGNLAACLDLPSKGSHR